MAEFVTIIITYNCLPALLLRTKKIQQSQILVFMNDLLVLFLQQAFLGLIRA